MFWLNIDYPTSICKLHHESCRYCTPESTVMKKVNEMGPNGGWVSFDNPQEAKEYFEENEADRIWQPCKVCKPFERND